jgi:hypothetical protein
LISSSRSVWSRGVPSKHSNGSLQTRAFWTASHDSICRFNRRLVVPGFRGNSGCRCDYNQPHAKRWYLAAQPTGIVTSKWPRGKHSRRKEPTGRPTVGTVCRSKRFAHDPGSFRRIRSFFTSLSSETERVTRTFLETSSLPLRGFLGANIRSVGWLHRLRNRRRFSHGRQAAEIGQKILQGEKRLRFRLLPHPRPTCSTGASFTGLASPAANILPAVLVAGVT